MKQFLDFEKPLAELQAKIGELREFSTDNVYFSNDIKKLEKKAEKLRKDIFSNLTRWQRTQLARHLNIPYSRLNNIIKGKSAVTPDTALRLSQVIGMSADFWLGLQQDWDLWQAMHRQEARAIFRLKPLVATEKSVSA